MFSFDQAGSLIGESQFPTRLSGQAPLPIVKVRKRACVDETSSNGTVIVVVGLEGDQDSFRTPPSRATRMIPPPAVSCNPVLAHALARSYPLSGDFAPYARSCFKVPGNTRPRRLPKLKRGWHPCAASDPRSGHSWPDNS